MKSIKGTNVILKDGELLTKERCNRAYLMELQSAALLQNFYGEAGMNQNYGSKAMAHGGWEDPTCQLRGHFLGHYLSACAVRYDETKDEEIKAKADFIVSELHKCQIENGGLWAASIPEKYFTWIARGKAVWAPHYTVHKTFLGLVDMYRYTGNKEALEVTEKFAQWFYDFVKPKTREEMDNILDVETGGMLEIWADLYEFTKKDMYLELIDKYDRKRLFDQLLSGVDALTNMHANTTIPEAIGAARVYEATGQERFRDIAFAYWDFAVNRRGTSVTGGQTCGEIWTPPHSMAARLGDKNQEHCTVYNMIRLADILFKWTGDHKYLDYIERNLYNGIMSQGYFKGGHANGEEAEYPEEGLITYFQPLRAGAKKAWASKFNDFFCCHGSLVQANSAHNRYLYYQDGRNIYTGVYAASEVNLDLGGQCVNIRQYRDTLSGSSHFSSDSAATQAIGEDAHIFLHHPDVMLQCFKVATDKDIQFSLNLRLPEWVHGDVDIIINGEKTKVDMKDGFFRVDRVFKNNDEVRIALPLDVYATELEGSEERMVAFSYGPYVLAGLCNEERTLFLNGHEPSELLIHANEREWGAWLDTFKSRYQERGIRFIPLKNVGYERYQVYFPIV